MVKKREGYRPFAPSVLEERAGEFFVLPPFQRRFPYMSVIVDVRPDKRALLGAVTHVDGTARIQTVASDQNPRYHALIDAFGRLTGVPILLNTSFNNHAEPIVDSLDDAIACFLTTGLHYLVAGDWLVAKRDVAAEAWLDVPIAVAPTLVLRASRHEGGEAFEAAFGYHHGRAQRVSPAMFDSASAGGRRQDGAGAGRRRGGRRARRRARRFVDGADGEARAGKRVVAAR